MPNPPHRKPAHGRRPSQGSHSAPRPPSPGRGWDNVATWYDKLVGDNGSDYHQNVILPATERLLQLQKGERLLDLCCGQGVLAPLATQAGVDYVGVDASPKLIESARQRIRHPKARFLISDVTKPGTWADGSFDAAACLMAVHDVPDLEPMFFNLAQALTPGGRALFIFMHPCFRIPRQTHWGWDEDKKIQYRRIDRYGQPLAVPIQTHPGLATELHTEFYHRPLAGYLNELGAAGLAVIGCEELYSHRRSQAGPRSRAEHRAAEEIPLFLALLAIKPSESFVEFTDE
jgi:ubiquinone/menaquinone biosynthesis C-methylase UbiE